MKATLVCCYIPGHSSGTSNSSLSLVLATDISYLIPESQVQCWVIGASPLCVFFSPANHIVTTSHFVHLHFDPPPRPNSSKAWPLRVTWMPGSAGRWWKWGYNYNVRPPATTIGIMVSIGNHHQMAARFGLVKYYNLPRYRVLMFFVCLRCALEGISL